MRTQLARGVTMKPVSVQIVAYAPTAFYHCQHCELTFKEAGLGDRIHREQARDALPPDLRAQFAEISDWVHEQRERHGDRIQVRVVDAASIEGVWKTLRHRLRRYPSFIVEGDKLVDPELSSVTAAVDGHVAAGSNSQETTRDAINLGKSGRQP